MYQVKTRFSTLTIGGSTREGSRYIQMQTRHDPNNDEQWQIRIIISITKLMDVYGETAIVRFPTALEKSKEYNRKLSHRVDYTTNIQQIHQS
jgi:hypothetical protein